MKILSAIFVMGNISVDLHAWKKCGIWSSHSREIFTFGGKYLQFWGEMYHLDVYFCLFLTKMSENLSKIMPDWANFPEIGKTPEDYHAWWTTHLFISKCKNYSTLYNSLNDNLLLKLLPIQLQTLTRVIRSLFVHLNRQKGTISTLQVRTCYKCLNVSKMKKLN